jgi:recombination associated protein RdgC
MMQVLDKVMQTDFLGRDFLTWLWFRSETGEGRFNLPRTGAAELWFDGPVTLQSEGSAGAEKVVCSSEVLTEARFALKEGRKVVQATLRITTGDDEWVCVMDALWLNFKSVKIPGTMRDKGEDPEGLFYERVFLMERLTGIMDELYGSFLDLRLSPAWREEELPRLNAWVAGPSIPA